MLVIYCDRCNRNLTEPGGLLFGPPDSRGFTEKKHLCVSCYNTVSGISAPAPIISLDKFFDGLSGAFAITYGTLGMVSGGFDPLHPGHASMILEAANQCGHLFVAVNSDNFLIKKKGKAFMDLETRCHMIAHLRGVGTVVPFPGADENDMTAIQPLKVLKPDVFFNGGDRKDMSSIPEWETCEKLGIKLVQEIGAGKKWASSNLLKDWAEWYNEKH